MIKLEDIHFSYEDLPVLKGIDLEIDKGEIISIVGASGAGKTTLLHILGTLEKPDSGKYTINGKSTTNLSSNELAKIRNLEIIAWTTLIFGLILYISDRFELKKKINDDFNIKSVFFIGFFQILSLIPGVSRSGIAITAARFLKFKRIDAAKISFFLSIPILGAVSVFGFMNIIFSKDSNFTIINLIAIIFSFIFSFFTIKYFLKYINQFSLNIFVYYRIILGLILLMLAYL